MTSTLANTTRQAVDRLRDRRDRIEHLLGLAEHLAEADRLLIEQVFRHGTSVADLARLAGKRPRSVQRSVRSLVNHMQSPLFRFLVVHGDLLPPATRRVAELVIFRRRSLRQAAITAGQTLHNVRQHMRTVQALARF